MADEQPVEGAHDCIDGYDRLVRQKDHCQCELLCVRGCVAPNREIVGQPGLVTRWADQRDRQRE